MKNIMQRLIILLVLSIPALAVAADAPGEAPKVYQMDMFSLISFGLAIAALVLSLFMGWLSWEFYKKSTEASEKSQQAVVKIETAVLSIQSEITEIVRQAVGYWTGADSPDDANVAEALAAKVEELSEQIKALAGNAANKQELEGKLAELVRMQRSQAAALSASIKEAKVRAIFPSVERGTLADVTHNMLSNTDNEKTGELVIKVLRPSKVITSTAKFSPPFAELPKLEVYFVDGDAKSVRLSSGVGAHSDFNVHLNGNGGGLVEPGTYVVKYKATINGTTVGTETHQ
jgi:CHASE3 domain sensor protein